MIAVTAIVRPSDSVQVLHLLEQCLRRHFASIPTQNDDLVIVIPGVGKVVITEQLALMRLDFVAANDDTAGAAMRALEKELQEQVRRQGLLIGWDWPSTIHPALQPEPFRTQSSTPAPVGRFDS
jgi:hypothetical protein